MCGNVLPYNAICFHILIMADDAKACIHRRPRRNGGSNSRRSGWNKVDCQLHEHGRKIARLVILGRQVRLQWLEQQVLFMTSTHVQRPLMQEIADVLSPFATGPDEQRLNELVAVSVGRVLLKKAKRGEDWRSQVEDEQISHISDWLRASLLTTSRGSRMSMTRAARRS